MIRFHYYLFFFFFAIFLFFIIFPFDIERPSPSILQLAILGLQTGTRKENLNICMHQYTFPMAYNQSPGKYLPMDPASGFPWIIPFNHPVAMEEMPAQFKRIKEPPSLFFFRLFSCLPVPFHSQVI